MSDQAWCRRCKRYWPVEHFRHNGRLRARIRARCIGCEITTRTERKTLDPWEQKAKWTRDVHARKYGVRAREFARIFGWTVARIAHDMAHAYQNGCCYCRKKFATMRHGPKDLSLDIVDPNAKPYYTTNVKYCCHTCNSEKQTMTPEAWARRIIFWEEYEAYWTGRPTEPPQMAMFA